MNILNPEFDKVQSTYRASTEDVLYQLQEIKKKTEENNINQSMVFLQLVNTITTIKNATTNYNGYQPYNIIEDFGAILGRTNFMYEILPGQEVDIPVFNGQRCFNYLLVIIPQLIGETGTLNIEVSNDLFSSTFVKCKLEDLQEITAHPYKLPPFSLATEQIYRLDLKGITKVKLNSQNCISAVAKLNFVV